MFASKPQKADVIRHWYSLVPNFNTSTRQFYEGVEKRLAERKIPGLENSRVDFAEGGLLSAKREYLRMTRERLVFDVCAAPFGTSYFFSCRFAELPAVVHVWQLLSGFVAFCVVVMLSWKFLGFLLGSFALIALTAFLIYLLRNAVALGLHDLDAAIIKSPLVGPIYERFLRKETYYREDTRLMYCDLVDQIVKHEVEEVTGANGIELITFNDYNPVLGDLYKPTKLELPAPEAKV